MIIVATAVAWSMPVGLACNALCIYTQAILIAPHVSCYVAGHSGPVINCQDSGQSSLFLNLRCLIVVFAHNFFRVISSEYTAFTDVSMAFRNRPSMQDMPVELVPSDFEVWVLVRVFVYRFEQFAIPRASRSLTCGGGNGLTGQGVATRAEFFYDT